MANADNPDAVGESRHPYGPCYHTKYVGCPPCVHSAWDEGYAIGLDAAETAVAELPLTGGWTTPDGVIEEIDKGKALAAIRALKEKP